MPLFRTDNRTRRSMLVCVILAFDYASSHSAAAVVVAFKQEGGRINQSMSNPRAFEHFLAICLSACLTLGRTSYLDVTDDGFSVMLMANIEGYIKVEQVVEKEKNKREGKGEVFCHEMST